MYLMQKLLLRGRGDVGSFAKKSLLAFTIKIASAGLAFFMFVALSRAMDARSYGIFGTLFSLATLCAVAGSFGQRTNVMRFAAKYDELGQADLRRGVTLFGYGIVAIGSVLATLGGLGFVALIPEIHGSAFLSGGLVVLTLGLGLSEFQSRALRVSAPVGLSLVPRDILWRALVCASAALVGLQFGRQAETAAVWSWYLGGTLLITCLIQWLVYESRHQSHSFRGHTAQDIRTWIKESRGPWASLVVISASANLSVFLVGLFLEIDKAGAFFSALRVAQLLNMFMLAIEVILIPAISRKVATEDWRQVQHLCSLTAAFAGGFGLLGAITLFFLGSPLLSLFGPETVKAYPALVVLSIGFAFNTLAGPTAPLLQMSGHAAQLARFQFVATLLGLGAMPWAIHESGTIGAAFCIAMISILWNICAWIFSRRTLGVDPTIFSLFIPTKASRIQERRNIDQVKK